jgi:SNF family Na+-dependent transporter
MYGKISYVTGLFPYFVFILLAIRGSMLDGAADGIAYYLKPDLSKLANINPWRDAAGLKFCFFYA